MNIEDFRNYCISLGEVSEKMPFGKFAERYDSILAFYVKGHMFCFIDINDFTSVDMKSTPETIDELRSRYASVDNPINRSLRHWVKIYFDGDISDSIILSLIDRAYDLVSAQYRTSRKI